MLSLYGIVFVQLRLEYLGHKISGHYSGNHRSENDDENFKTLAHLTQPSFLVSYYCKRTISDKDSIQHFSHNFKYPAAFYEKIKGDSLRQIPI